MSRTPSPARSAHTPAPAASASVRSRQTAAEDLDYGAAWELEIDRRIEEVRAGKVETIPAEQVFAEIDAELARRGRGRTRAGR